MSDEAPAIEQDEPQAVEAPEAPAQPDESRGGPEDDSGFESPSLDDIPAELRPQAEALEKQFKSAYTQKRQADREEVAQQVREAEEAQAVIEGLRDPNLAPSYLRLLGVDPTDKQFLESLGLAYADEGMDELDEELDPTDALAQKVDGIAQVIQGQQQQAEQAQYQEELNDYVADELDRHLPEGVEPTAEEIQALETLALSNADARGLPDVQGAVASFTGILKGREASWTEAAKERAAGRPPGEGAPAEPDFDPSDRTQRREAMAKAVEEARANAEGT